MSGGAVLLPHNESCEMVVLTLHTCKLHCQPGMQTELSQMLAGQCEPLCWAVMHWGVKLAQDCTLASRTLGASSQDNMHVSAQADND